MLPSAAWVSTTSSSPTFTLSTRARTLPSTTPCGSSGSSQSPADRLSPTSVTLLSRTTSTPRKATPAEYSPAAIRPPPSTRALPAQPASSILSRSASGFSIVVYIEGRSRYSAAWTWMSPTSREVTSSCMPPSIPGISPA